MDKLREIDFLVYEYIFNESNRDGFVDYLRNNDDIRLVGRYCTDMTQAWSLIQRLSEKAYEISLNKLKDFNEYQCAIQLNVLNDAGEIIDTKRGYASSELPSIAICLALLDVFDKKELYLEETRNYIEKLKQDKSERIKTLEERGITFPNISTSIF